MKSSNFGSIPNERIPFLLVNMVRVLSQNMYLRPGLIQHRHGDNKRARFLKLLSLLPQYDVVCLQEMWYRRADLLIYAAKVGLPYYAVSPKSLKTDGGLVILSRYPMVEKRFFLFKNGIFPDTMIRKGALAVRIVIGNSNLRVINLHAQSSYKKIDPDAHRVQLTQLRATLKWAGLQPHTLVLGDFNLDGMQHDLSPIFVHYKNAVPSTPTSLITFLNDKEIMSTAGMCKQCKARLTTGMQTVPMQLDHAWITPDLKVSAFKTRSYPLLSDHAGLDFKIVSA